MMIKFSVPGSLATLTHRVMVTTVLVILCPLRCNGIIPMTTLTMSGSGNLTKGVTSRITCNTQGDPNPLIHWSLGDATIFEGIHVLIAPMIGGNQNVTNTLEFNPACEHHGKLLTCTATQDVDGVVPLSQSILLRVTDNTGTATECPVAVPSNSVRTSPSAINVTLGNPVTISCLSDVTSGVTYQWVFNGAVVGTSATLQIKSVVAANDGLYTCTVTHSGGSNSATVDINVQYAPFLSTNLVNINASNGERLSLTCGNNANPPASFYIWTHGNTSVNLKNHTFSLVMGSSNFKIYCKAGNTIGLSGTTVFNVVLGQSTGGTDTDGSLSSLALASSLGTVEIAAISMGSLSFLILLVLLLLFCCCCGACHACCAHKKKDKHKTYPLVTSEKDVIYVIKIPRFYENPSWTTSRDNCYRKSNCLVSPFDEMKSGPIISIYDDEKEHPDYKYHNNDQYILLNEYFASSTKC